jgi:hypothetical protein
MAIRLRRLYLMPGTLASPALRETREKPPGPIPPPAAVVGDARLDMTVVVGAG